MFREEAGRSSFPCSESCPPRFLCFLLVTSRHAEHDQLDLIPGGHSAPYLTTYAKWCMLGQKQGVDAMDKLYWTKWGCEHVIRAKVHRPFKFV